MVVQLEHVTKFYKNEKNKLFVIKDMSIIFPRNGMVAIVGKSGCGKSTLLNLIAGIELASEGKIKIDGHELDYHYIDEYRRNYISYVYQFYNLVDALTIKENLLLAAKVKEKKISSEQFDYWVKKVGIDLLLDNFPNELSGGQKQRVGLIRAFLCNTPILLADEPTGALNDQMGQEVMQLLKQYARNHLVIIISHNLALINKYTKLVIDLDDERKEYNFNLKNKYHKYLIDNSNHQPIKLLFYLKRQVLYQKKKIMMMFCSQIFTIIAFVLLISGSNGIWQYVQTRFESNPLKEIIEVTKSEYTDTNFTVEQVQSLSKDSLIEQITFKLAFNIGVFKDDKEMELNSYQLYQADYLNFLKGHFPKRNNEILINQETAKEYRLDVGQKINYLIENSNYQLTIAGIINDYVNSGENIYFDVNFIDNSLKEGITDNSTLIIRSKHVDKVIKKYEKDYLMLNFHQDYLDNYQMLFELAKIVIICFLIVSFMISLILISIVLKTILIERKRDVSLLLANGLTKKKSMKLFVQETALIGSIIGIMGSLLSKIALVFIEFFNVSERLFGIDTLFVMPKYFFSNADLYVILVMVYCCACILAGFFTSLKISNMDISVLLKED